MKNLTVTIIFLLLFTLAALAQKTKPTDYSQKIAEATPEALPQTPAVKRQTSDAQNDGLKGKVKTVSEQSEGFVGITKGVGKTMSNYYEFDEQGNYLKQINYEYRGIPIQISVYGYLDNKRVSRSGSIRFGDELRTVAVGVKPKEESKKTSDPRFDMSYEFEYENGKLVKKTLTDNKGEKSMHYIYRYQNGQEETLAYDEDGKLNWKYVDFLDEKGNETGYISYRTSQPDTPEATYKYLNAVYDEKGNWIKRTRAEVTMKKGKEQYETYYIEYRTITYYP
ncbi:MAG TPA: hypothetical protein PKY59_18300 [Pyrinomonadaceae bacterium]|nr:hypothetical protein [Pyrinomonadaceae bacterium]